MDAFQRNHKEFNVFIDVFENIGRDVAPFIEQMRHIITKYKFICHIHSKKSITDSFGNNWRDYLFQSLFGSSENIAHIIKNLEYNKGLGIVFPKSFQRLEEATHWSLNKNIAEKLYQRIAYIFPTITQEQIKSMYASRSDFVHGKISIPIYKDYGYFDFDDVSILACALLLETMRKLAANNATQILFDVYRSYRFV